MLPAFFVARARAARKHRPVSRSAFIDRPIRAALFGPQAAMARGGALARGFDPAVAIFAAARNASAPALAALAALAPRPGDRLLLVESAPRALPGFDEVSRRACVQMHADAITPGPVPDDLVELGAADAPQMLALATLTAPGPFSTRTHLFGGFVGVRRAGRLVAMAGERLRVAGRVEVSGVCTHPDVRGQGLAAQLSRVVAGRILARGARPFLHSYAENTTAVTLYERLGFRIEGEVEALMLTRTS
jgi:ribosomal protein S18 acetylase RimI-like enzyme